jgi:hypothetical protein
MDQNHYLSNIDSIGTETIVYNLKYAIENNSHAEYFETLEMQLKQKNDDIEKICTDNWQEFLENFKKFIIHKRLLSSFSSKVDLFNEKIYKISLRNKYDTSEINNKKKAIENINKTLKHLGEVTDIFSLLNKSVDNLSNEKFMASIRTISQIKKKPLLGPQNSTSMIKHVVSEISPMIFLKIRTKSDGFMNEWINYTKAKQLEVGIIIVTFYEEGFRNNLASFNVNLNATNGSTINNRQSLYFGNKNEGGFNERLEILKDKNEAFKDSFAPRYTISQSKMRYFEFKIDLHLLNQCQQIYENINEYLIFLENLKTYRQKQLINICDEPVVSAKDMRNYICQVLGFFVIERELTRHYNNYNFIESLWLDGLRKIEKNMASCFEKMNNSSEFLEIKNELHMLGFIVQKLGFQGQSTKLLMVIKDNFLRFSEKIINTYMPNLIERINNDGFSRMMVTSVQDYEQLSRIFDENFREVASFQKETEFTFKFTEVIPEIAELVRKFLQNNLIYLRGVMDLEGLIHIQLDRFYFKIYEAFKILIDKRVLNVLQVGQTIENMGYMGNSLKYFKNLIENNFKILCSREYEAFFYFDQLKMNCEELIQEMTKQKIDEFLENYFNVDWTTKHPNTKHQGFIQDLGDFLLGVFGSMKMINAEIVNSLIYLTFKHINVQILNILCDEKIKHFNIIGLVNLQFDVLFLFGLCGDKLAEHANLMECLREIRQFLDLFLLYHPSDLLDPNLRNTKYNQLSIQKMILLFKKYKKIVVGKYPVIRKRQVKATMDKLKLEFQNN